MPKRPEPAGPLAENPVTASLEDQELADPKAKLKLRPPSGKQLRVRIQRPEVLQALREKLRSPEGVGGVIVVPWRQLTDGDVIDFALLMADLFLHEDIVVIRRSEFLRAVKETLNRHIESMAKMTEEEREAFLETLVIAQMHRSAFVSAR